MSIASAQVADGGKALRLTFGQSFQYSDNIDLVADPQGDTLRSSTQIGLDYKDVTRVHRFEFSTNAAFQLDNNSDENEVSDPVARFLYAREGTNTRFSFSADYRRSDLDDVTLPLSVLFPELALDDQVSDNVAVIETGERTDVVYDFEIETGMEALVGFRLDMSSRERRYSELQLFDVVDNTLNQAEAELTFRINPSLTARVLASVRDFTSEDEDDSGRKRVFWGAGLTYDVTASTQFDLFVGRQEVDRQVADEFLETDGVRVSAGLTRTLPNGEIEVDFLTQPTLAGRETTLEVSRAQALARGGALEYGIGVSYNPDFAVEPLFSVAYVKPLQRGRFNINFDQTARPAEGTVDAVVLSQLSMQYALALSPTTNLSLRAGAQDFSVRATDEFRRSLNLRSDLVGQINDISSWSFGATLTDTSVLNEGEKTGEKRYGIEMAYRRALTRDWNMVARYQHSAILDDDEDDRRANTISLGLERSFDIRF